mmetsp:Transcript_14302/g.26816  ORF Transcript_14302/g.26816 Transcript_14302/m.26816 type:complete len:268 (+) Transcript_14302:1057-1860(+)
MSFVADGSVMAVPTFEVMRMCFACVVYHNRFLRDHLHSSNRFRSHPAMCHLPNFLLENEDKCRPMLHDEANACALCPRLTGIPPHVVQLNQVAVLRSIVERTSDSFREILSSELNARSVGGEVFQANEILQEVRRISLEMQHVINTVNHPLETTGADGSAGAGAGNVARVGDDDRVVFPSTRSDHPLMYIWGGRLHNLPENFVLPKMNLQTLIVYWFCGSKHPLIPALKNVKSWDFKNPKTMKVVLSQMRVLVSHVLRGYEHRKVQI